MNLAAATGIGGLVVGVAATGWFCLSQRKAERAADQATIAAQTVTISDLQKRSRGVDTVHLRDTLRLTQTVNHRDTVYAKARIDTFTVTVPVEVVREVLKADTAVIQACTAALHSCEEQQGILRQIITADSSALRATSRELARAKIRSRIACAVGPTAAVVSSTLKISYIGVSCGLRVF